MPTIRHRVEQVVQLEGVKLAYDSFGDPESPPLLLIAGLGNQLISWRENFCRQLAARGLWVIRFDNRDSGHSSRFDHAQAPGLLAIAFAYLWGFPLQAPYTLFDMANDVRRLLDHLEIERAHVVGASLGGLIAQALSLRHAARLCSLTLMLTSLSGSRWPPPRPKSLILFRPQARGLEAQVERYLQTAAALKGPRFPLDPPALRQHAERLYERSPDPPGSRRQLAAIAAARISPRAISALNLPTLVVHGSADPLLPPGHARRLAKLIPGAQLLLIDGLGHEFPPGVWPEVVDSIARHTTNEAR